VVCAIEVALCLLAASYFKGGERDARIAIVGVLALVLVKWIFNSSPANLSYSNILALPVMLAFVPWRETLPELPARKHFLAGLVQTGILVVMLPYAALQVRHELQWKYDFDHKFISHYATAPWTQLGERLPVITPQAPILERVAAVRREIRPGEKMLIISPFDQLTSFYVNPAGFCGHFEVISNLTTTDSVKAIAACVKNHALVVVDSAIDMPCPIQEYEILGKNPQTALARKVCPTKEKMKRNAALLLKQIGPLKKVGEQGPLSFYRS
jgi:hypothetical protein